MYHLNFEMLNNKCKITFVFFTILFCSLIYSKEVFAQNISLSELTPHKYALENLKAALSSDNCGIKRSTIYLIGKYKIAEGESMIEKIFRTEEDSCTRILAALVLFKLNRVKGLSALKQLSKTDLNEETRRLALQTFYQHLINDTEPIKVKQKID